MLRRVQKYIRDNALLEHGARVLVCVSGGADSIALWDVLQRGGYECIVAHCNFHLRGEESDRDERFVRSVAIGNGQLAIGERREAKGERLGIYLSRILIRRDMRRRGVLALRWQHASCATNGSPS